MSQTETGSTLPDPQTAYDNLVDGVYAEVFFRKCASAGHVPGTQDEARAMIDTAAQLRAAGQVKQAGAPSRVFALRDAVQQAIGGDPGYALKAAADALFADPTVYNSVLALKAAQADQIRAELAARK